MASTAALQRGHGEQRAALLPTELSAGRSKTLLVGILGSLIAALLLIGFGAPTLKGSETRTELVGVRSAGSVEFPADGAAVKRGLGVKGLRAAAWTGAQGRGHSEVFVRALAAKAQAEHLRAARAATHGGDHLVRKAALIVPPQPAGGRETELVNVVQGSQSLSRAEQARCVGFLHACQSWLELKDGKNNTIEITDPDNVDKVLVHYDVVLPTSGDKIPDHTWTVLQSSCRYGLADLSKCNKPSHWPICSGSACSEEKAQKKAKKDGSSRKQSRH